MTSRALANEEIIMGYTTLLWNIVELDWKREKKKSGPLRATSDALYLEPTGFRTGPKGHGVTAQPERGSIHVEKNTQVMIVFRIACNDFDFVRWYDDDPTPKGTGKLRAYMNTPVMAQRDADVRVLGWSASTLVLFDGNQKAGTFPYFLKLAGTTTVDTAGRTDKGYGVVSRTNIGWWDPQIDNDGSTN